MKFGIGQPVRRKEDDRLLRGKGRFVDDLSLPGQVFAHVARSPVAHGRLSALDLSAARAAPGVLLVWSWADVAGRLAPIANQFPLKQADGSDVPPVVMPHLADGVTRYVGQPVAFVVARTRAQARDAAELIEMAFDDLPVVVDPEAALAPDAPQLHDCAPGNLAYRWTIGDEAAVEAAFARAARTVRTRVTNQRIIVNAMEPRATLARWDAEAERWEVWAATQGVHALRAKLSAQLMVPPEKIRVRTPDVGGGFGMKLQAHPEDALVALAARELGRPVKWTADRSESFLADVQGRDLTTEAEGAFDENGRILAMRCRSISNLGAYLSSVGVGVHTVFSAPLTGGMYDLPCFHHEVRGVLTNTTPTDAYRGAGRPEAIHVTEAVIEAGARAFGMDPAEFRRINLIKAEQVPYRSHGGFEFDSLDPEAALKLALEASDQAGFPARREAARARGRLLGRGVIYYFERTGGAPIERATLELDPEGVVRAAVGTQSNGQGHETAWAQIIHEKLGVPLDAIQLLEGDSDLLPAGGGTGGSRSLIMAGRVFLKAADEVIEKALAAASELLEAAPADIEFRPDEGGLFRIKGTDRTVTLFDAARELGGILGAGAVDDSIATFPNGCHAAEVEIDPETGAVAVTRYVAADDFGTVINPLIVEGQVHGGVAQGLGQALGERAAYDPETGQPLAGSFMDYWMPRAADLPPFEVLMSPTMARTNPLGAKGCGEAGSVGAVPAAALAVQDALRAAGAEPIEPPYTPCRVWEALQAARP
ncbi:xanthine dehydrogenase family protein molybdopterin-binding subunit [Oceanicella actignis]|uniref:Carbon-monoxide dehydrogenase large subunit n=1 Tax=Oceanicella actignis TaxID=1189325 RepID=A0A1M7TKH6_9RHOB|nr:xanthine dehydrogenase family protein molybdopterin-binding subunit [Oceanicella actignis]SET68349.1 carbon-monoxide dehydrogenase large subunit [Oceanicella actignis]SHN71234.1 carbon-monoxide dehydrogenase large subunit [Oceanicella actignis]